METKPLFNIVDCSRNQSHYKPNYCITLDEKRESIIKDVTEHKMKIKEAAIKYDVKYSTAKTIVKIYKIEGRSHKKERRVKKKEIPTDKANYERTKGNINPQFTTLPANFWCMALSSMEIKGN